MQLRVRGSWWSVIIGAAFGTPACSSSSEPPAMTMTSSGDVAASNAGPRETVYELTRRTEIEIELSSADWDALRHEGRSMAALMSPVVPDYDYGEYSGNVEVDGVLYEGVEIQKKGFIGSLSVLRPSLRLDFQRAGVDLESGLRRLTLNSDVQDRSHVRQCMAFELFARAGIATPRCSLSHVTVNGLDLGTYTNVEPIRRPMLRRHFAESDGNLYEGTLADFDDASWERIERQTNDDSDRSDLRRLVDALNASDEALVGSLGPLIDLDHFRTFWAMETLLGHWDGYAEIANNYYLYHDPATEQFSFIPWGLDQTFVGERPFSARPYHATVYAGAKLARRLYALPDQREMFRARLGELNDELWEEPALLERSAAIARLAPDVAAPALEAQDEFLRTRGAELRAALGEPAPAPESLEPEPPVPPSCVASAPITAELDAGWQLDGLVATELTLDGTTRQMDFFGALDTDDVDPEDALLSTFAPLESGGGLVLLLFMPGQLVRPGAHAFHGFETWGLLGRVTDTGAFTNVAFVGDGQLQLDAAATSPGAPVTGRLEAVLYQTACVEAAAPAAP